MRMRRPDAAAVAVPCRKPRVPPRSPDPAPARPRRAALVRSGLLGVHDAVRSQVLRALRCDPDERVPGLHHLTVWPNVSR